MLSTGININQPIMHVCSLPLKTIFSEAGA